MIIFVVDLLFGDLLILLSFYSFVYINGDFVNLICIVFGGNFIVNFLWECGFKDLIIVKISNFLLVVLVLILKVDKVFNNKDCICIVSYFF